MMCAPAWRMGLWDAPKTDRVGQLGRDASKTVDHTGEISVPSLKIYCPYLNPNSPPPLRILDFFRISALSKFYSHIVSCDEIDRIFLAIASGPSGIRFLAFEFSTPEKDTCGRAPSIHRICDSGMGYH